MLPTKLLVFAAAPDFQSQKKLTKLVNFSPRNKERSYNSLFFVKYIFYSMSFITLILFFNASISECNLSLFAFSAKYID